MAREREEENVADAEDEGPDAAAEDRDENGIVGSLAEAIMDSCCGPPLDGAETGTAMAKGNKNDSVISSLSDLDMEEMRGHVAPGAVRAATTTAGNNGRGAEPTGTAQAPWVKPPPNTDGGGRRFSFVPKMPVSFSRSSSGGSKKGGGRLKPGIAFGGYDDPRLLAAVKFRMAGRRGAERRGNDEENEDG